ncbi:MAG: hypothetical protein J6B01_10150 [Ruminococcus sp.]|nr:hypothetical protein [Ruminococcus sp.]MBP3379598.1 hypothetical protein [Ruminococcus sp.]
MLLRTKELFYLDKSRLSKEHGVNYFRGLSPRNKKFDDERIKSNKKEFRKKSFEDIILQYQVNPGNLSDDEFKKRLNKLYVALDKATIDIEKWHPTYQAFFYRSDLRKYIPDAEPIVEDSQIRIPMKADMPQ